ncbi:MAG: hypothetical protein IKA26_00925 [Alistipes sp.]|nr:hypothetical protein [Alistipes sp.]
MAWHEVIAWIIIVAAFVATAVWCIRRIFCPASHCESCSKDCRYRKEKRQ